MRARSSYRNKVFSALSFSKCFFLFVLPFALSQLRTIFILITVGTMDKEENDVPVFHLFSLFTALHFSRRRTSVNDILCDRMMAKEEKLKIIGKHHQTHITRTDYVCACISYCLVGYQHKTSHFFFAPFYLILCLAATFLKLFVPSMQLMIQRKLPMKFACCTAGDEDEWRDKKKKTLTINNVITYQFDWDNGFAWSCTAIFLSESFNYNEKQS